jgi:2-hydroxy-6-oxonona-2,4-dienedioate hydrolase
MLLGRRRFREDWSVVNGLKMFARVSANDPERKAPAVVLVHGLGVSSRYMMPLAYELAATFRVYCPDLPGYGKNAWPAEVRGPRALAKALAEWMRGVRLRHAVIVANSMGCQITVELADLWHEATIAAVLTGPTMDQTVGSPFTHIWRLLRDQFHEPISLVPLQAFDYVTNGPLRTVETFRKALGHDMLSRVHVLSVPTVLMRGEHDPIASQEFVGLLADRMSRATVETVPGAGHALNYNSPKRVAETVRRLIRAQGF